MNIEEIRQFGNIELLAKQMVEGFITGLHKSPYHGFSVEFAEHRLYNTGESTRHIDWKVFARTDRLYVKRYEEETNLRAHILLDTSSSMFYPEKNKGKITFGITAAAALAYMLQKQRDAVALHTFSDKIETQTAVKSTSTHVRQIMITLQQLLAVEQKQKTTAAAKTIDEIAQKIHRRSLVIILSDMLDSSEDENALFAALQHLKHRNHEVILFHIKDSKTEELFDFEDRPYRFEDLETGEIVKLQPAQVRALYREKITQKYENLKLRCGQYKIDFIEADIGKNIDQILLPYLMKRAKM
ncbi:MAG: DUF58 domain-containing protein [Bernardetiaceae bacterium]|nr:DUF58 domain-containing protein [Bernardetiaceae bacterium]